MIVLNMPTLCDPQLMLGIFLQLKRRDPRIRTGLTGASSCLELVVEDSPTVQHPWMFWPLDKMFRVWFWFLNNWLWYILGASFIIFYKTDACNGR